MAAYSFIIAVIILHTSMVFWLSAYSGRSANHLFVPMSILLSRAHLTGVVLLIAACAVSIVFEAAGLPAFGALVAVALLIADTICLYRATTSRS